VIDINTMKGANIFEGVGQVKNPKMKRHLEKYKYVQDGLAKRIATQAVSRSCD
jgi:hypothetical protein